MKRYIVICCLLPFLTGLFACESEMMDYEGVDGIYFRMQSPPVSGYGDPERYAYIDSTFINFAMFTGKDSTLALKVRTMGDVVDYDRYFRIVVVDSLSTAKAGVDYEAFEPLQLVAAGKSDVAVDCRIIWTEKLALDPDMMLYLTVRLIENEYFSLPMKAWYPLSFLGVYGTSGVAVSPDTHVVCINDQVNQPKTWWVNYFGTFSATKYKLMCEVCGLTLDDFASATAMSLDRALAIGQRMDKYLKEMKAIDQTVYDTDALGNQIEMKMGTLVG